MALIRREDVWALVGDHVMTVRPGSKLEWLINHYANAIDGAPEVDAVPVVHARWIPHKTPSGRETIFERCSACKQPTLVTRETPYCPWCGARMDGERRDSE